MFSVIDAKDEFWQVKPDEESSYFTKFWFPCGKLRWFQFAINTAPGEYQIRQAEHVSDLPGVVVIADDHLVFFWGNTTEEALVTRKSQED